MKKVYYEKIVTPGGRVRYKPAAEYDSELIDSFDRGNHLIMVYPGGASRKYHIEPALAPMIAAGRIAADEISRELVRAGELRLSLRERGKKMTAGQQAAWANLIEEFGEGARQLEWPSAREVTDAGVNAMIEEAQKLLDNPSVREAWEQFQTICLLTREDNKG